MNKRFFLIISCIIATFIIFASSSNAQENDHHESEIGLFQASCPNAPLPRLEVGEGGIMIDSLPNSIRSEPRVSAEKIGEIPPRGEFTVLNGPVCHDGFAYWEVEYEDIQGWTAEGQDDEYWLKPISNLLLNIPSTTPQRRSAPNGLEGVAAFGGGGPCNWDRCIASCSYFDGDGTAFRISNGIGAYYIDEISANNFQAIEIASTSTLRLSSDQFPLNPYQLPQICVAQSSMISNSYALSPSNQTYNTVKEYNGDHVSVGLPYDAYLDSGEWQLVVNGYSIRISIPRFEPSVAVVPIVGNRNIWWGVGFEPNEDIILVTGTEGFGNYTQYQAQADGNGSFFMDAEQSSGMFFVSGENGSFYEHGYREETFPANLAQVLWGSNGSLDDQCDGYLTPRLQIGQQAYIIDLNGEANALNSAPKRPSRNPDSQRLSSIPVNAVFTVLSGPVCGEGNIVWWYVDYNGTLGWTGESQGNTYWAAPY